MKNVGLGLQGYLNTKGYYPNAGTFLDIPGNIDPTKSIINACFTGPFTPTTAPAALYSWVVDILPYLDQQDMANAWDKTNFWQYAVVDPNTNNPTNQVISGKSIGVLICPDDLTVQPGQGNLSYVVNGGFTRWIGNTTIGWTGTATGGSTTPLSAGSGVDWSGGGGGNALALQANVDYAFKTGVMFLGTSTGTTPYERKTTPSSINDGSSQTILGSENLHAGVGGQYAGGLPTNWACPHPNAIMFTASDNISMGSLAPISGPADGPGWSFANKKITPPEYINFGGNIPGDGLFINASSNHSGGINVLFCDGGVRFISDSVDGTVYSKMITPNGGRLPATVKQMPLGSDEF
jgi:prepilin-type processing-associated H-X9-DG protein